MIAPSNYSLFQQFSGFLKTHLLFTDTNYFPFPSFLLKETKVPEVILDDLIIPPKLVLGKRLEAFFLYYISNFSAEEVLANNIQIISDKITIGELDFLLKNKFDGKITHVELVYKFYLYDPSFATEEERWIGPNRRDTMIKKLNRLKNLQFPLLHKKETRPLLDQLNINVEEVEQKVCFKANLFVPIRILNKDFPLINTSCITGFWIRFSEFTEKDYGGFQFLSPKKANWPISPEHGKDWFSFEEIQQQLLPFLNREKSPLVWMKKSESEFCRFFVVWW